MSSASETQTAYLSRDLEMFHGPIFPFSRYFAGDPFTLGLCWSCSPAYSTTEMLRG